MAISVQGVEVITNARTLLNLSSPITVNLGGTGTTTLSGVVIGNGTNPFTAKANPTGAFVGTTDTQTLSNKTLSGANNTFTDIDLADSTIGTLTVGRGGTGRTTFSTGGMLLGNGSNGVNVLVGSSIGQIPQWNGTTWSVGSLPAEGVLNVTASAPLASSGGGTPNISLTGTVPTGNGGTGQTTYSNGQLLIGNSSNSLTKASLTGGTNISVTNGNGAITITSNIGTPSTLTTSTTNSANASSHTHAVTFPVTSVNGQTGAVSISENLYYAGNGISLSGTTFSVAGGTGLTQNSTGLGITNIAAGSSSSGALYYNGTTKSAGRLYGGTSAPTSSTRLNYDGYLYATRFYGDGSNLTNLTPTTINLTTSHAADSVTINSPTGTNATINPAGSSTAGIMTTGAQTFAGNKTFTGVVSLNNTVHHTGQYNGNIMEAHTLTVTNGGSLSKAIVVDGKSFEAWHEIVNTLNTESLPTALDTDFWKNDDSSWQLFHDAAFTTSQSRHGTFNIVAGSATSGSFLPAINKKVVRATPGQRFTVGGWVKAYCMGPSGVAGWRVDWLDINLNEITSADAALYPVDADGQWHKVQNPNGYAPGGTHWARLSPFIYGHNACGNIHFDNGFMQPVEDFYSLGVGTAPSTSNKGEIRATGNIIGYYSDARLKNFTGRIDGALNKINALNGYYYTENAVAKELGFKNDQIQVGLSAQEVELVLPEVVTLAPFDMEERDDGTTVSKSGLDYKTLQYEKLIPLIVEAIKELSNKIDSLENRIN